MMRAAEAHPPGAEDRQLVVEEAHQLPVPADQHGLGVMPRHQPAVQHDLGVGAAVAALLDQPDQRRHVALGRVGGQGQQARIVQRHRGVLGELGAPVAAEELLGQTQEVAARLAGAVDHPGGLVEVGRQVPVRTHALPHANHQLVHVRVPCACPPSPNGSADADMIRATEAGGKGDLFATTFRWVRV